jgi:hypothetical protein
VFKYTDGTPQFLGYKPMNHLGFLSDFRYSQDDIAKYLNTEIDQQISRGIIPKNIQRPYVTNKDRVILPHYGIKQFKEGGVIKDDRGQWEHPGEITEINSPYITMKGVPYPVLGISDTGDTQMMYPEEEYEFEGNKVTEYPLALNGININKQSKNWLDKYNNEDVYGEQEIEKAQDGIVQKIKTNLNPYNWGVPDYTDKFPDKDKAFAAARKAGEKEYLYKGVRYLTDIKNEDRPESSFTLNKEKRQKIYNSVNPVGYPQQELIPSIKRYATNKSFKDEIVKNPNEDESRKSVIDEDAWAFFMGVPQQKNSIGQSKYKPSNAKDENSQYYTLRNAYPDFENIVLNDANAMFNKEKKANNKVIGRSSFLPLENVTYSKGKDDRGDYYSIYDVYDFSVPFEDKIGKPYEIYDRVYYKDYGDEVNKPMYYSDKELSELDVNKKNFDTLALQRELSNRGVKFEKSVKKDGSFDGILGEETKAALLDYQTKSKKSSNKKNGGNITKAKDGKELVKLNQLSNFTNYNKPQPGGWLNKYN